MYQTEINGAVEALDQISADVAQRFTERRAAISARSVLAWSEHCKECAAPACFQTCDLYEARYPDAQCRRFVGGMVRIDHPESTNGYLLKIAFKRWGKLWTPASAPFPHAGGQPARAPRPVHRSRLAQCALSGPD